MPGRLSLFHSHLQPGVLLKDGGVDTTRLEFHIVQFSKAAHQVGSAPIDSVLRGGSPRKKQKKGNRRPVFFVEIQTAEVILKPSQCKGTKKGAFPFVQESHPTVFILRLTF